ncbi:MAG: GGDEF domain-containing protein [Deltaproteobacteria bacterium]|nr:GGDEF domain-containing protein [Deltaproteobacteria bacterium]
MLANPTTTSGTAPVGAASHVGPVLTMLEGEEANRSWLLGEKELVFGRDLTCDVPLADAKASLKHARVRWTNPQFGCDQPVVVVRDLGSTHGTWVNGRRIEGEVELREDDRLLVGSTLFGYALRLDEAIEAQRPLVQRAATDPLIALANREVFDRTLRREFEHARRYTRPLSLLLADADDIQSINDRFGHRVGDLVIRQIGRIVRDNLRLSDPGARLGGEEFAILLPETPLDGALAVGERLRAAVAEFPMVLNDEPLRATVSVGVVELDGSFHHPNAFLEAGERALHLAKRGGKNRCVVHVRG